MSELTDRGVHKTQSDIWEEDLKAAGWVAVAKHSASPVWWSPIDQQFHPGPGAAWDLMKAHQEQTRNTGKCPTCGHVTPREERF